MKSFANGQRVVVVAHDRPLFDGMTGTVVRIRRDGGAWVQADIDLPTLVQSFPAGDSRQNHFLVYPDECEAL